MNEADQPLITIIAVGDTFYRQQHFEKALAKYNQVLSLGTEFQPN